MRKRIYLAGPITRGCLAHNINQGTDAFLRLTKAGLAPFCPMWSCYSGRATRTPEGHVIAFAGVTPNELTHDDWYGLDLAWVAVSDAVLRLPGESTGADGEVDEAKRRGIPVYYSVEAAIDGFRAATVAAPVAVKSGIECVTITDKSGVIAMNGSGGTSLSTQPATKHDEPQRYLYHTREVAVEAAGYRYRTFGQTCRLVPWDDKWAVEVLNENAKPASKEHVFNTMLEAELYAVKRQHTTDKAFRSVPCGDKWTVEEVTEATQ